MLKKTIIPSEKRKEIKGIKYYELKWNAMKYLSS